MNGKLEGKAAVVTGGAGGAGMEISRLFVKEGAKVVIADMNEDGGNKLAEELGENCMFVKTNVTSEKSVEDCLASCASRFGSVDILVNIACIMGVDTGFLEDVTEEMFDKDIAINLKGTFFFIKHALKYFQKEGKGTIVNFSSVGGIRGTIGHVIYGCAKSGVESLTRSVVAEYGKCNIRANCICPGIMMNPVTLQNPGAKEYADWLLSHTPATRIGMGSDAAPVALFLASDDSYYINGQVITMDGGLTSHEPQWKEDLALGKDALR